MSVRNYWLDLFTGFTWNEFKKAGGHVTGFRESRWKTVQKITIGDYLICYLTGVSRFIGMLEVTSEAFRDDTAIWSDESFPCRLKVKTVVELTPETAIPVHNLKDSLSFFQNLSSPTAWTGHFRGSPQQWKRADGEVILSALLEAKENPITRPVDQKKLARRPQAVKAKIGSVTIPDSENETSEKQPESAPVNKTKPKISAFRAIQEILLMTS